MKATRGLSWLLAGLAALGCMTDEESGHPPDPTMSVVAKHSRHIKQEELTSAKELRLDEAAFATFEPRAPNGQRVRVLRAFALPNDDVAVITDDSRSETAVHLFDPKGRVKGVAQAPVDVHGTPLRGENNYVTAGDSVFVVGALSRLEPKRIWKLESNGTQVERAVLGRDVGRVVGSLTDGSVIALALSERNREEGNWQLYPLLRIGGRTNSAGPHSTIVDTIINLGVERDGQTGDRLLWAHDPRVTIAVGNDRIWLALSGAATVVALSPIGDPLLSVSWEVPERPVAQASLEQWRKHQVALLPDSLPADRRAATIAALGLVRSASQYPAVQMISGNAAGQLYVKEFANPELPNVEEMAWLVFDDRGELIGRLFVPSRITILGFGNGFAIGVATRGDWAHVSAFRIVPVASKGDASEHNASKR